MKSGLSAPSLRLEFRQPVRVLKKLQLHLVGGFRRRARIQVQAKILAWHQPMLGARVMHLPRLLAHQFELVIAENVIQLLLVLAQFRRRVLRVVLVRGQEKTGPDGWLRPRRCGGGNPRSSPEGAHPPKQDGQLRRENAHGGRGGFTSACAPAACTSAHPARARSHYPLCSGRRSPSRLGHPCANSRCSPHTPGSGGSGAARLARWRSRGWPPASGRRPR